MKLVRSKVSFGEHLKHVITLRGPFMVSRKLAIRDEPNIRFRCSRNVTNTCFTGEQQEADDDPSLLLSPVCPSNTSPCLRPKRPCVCRHHAHILKRVCTWCQCTRGRFERTHGDVLSGHTAFFSVSHTTHHTAHTHHNHNTRHNTTQHIKT